MYLLQACDRNDQLVTDDQLSRGLDPALLANFRRRATMVSPPPDYNTTHHSPVPEHGVSNSLERVLSMHRN